MARAETTHTHSGCGEAVVVGGIDVLIGWLIAHGYVSESQVAHDYATGPS